jgi:hypothetical protein
MNFIKFGKYHSQYLVVIILLGEITIQKFGRYIITVQFGMISTSYNIKTSTEDK